MSEINLRDFGRLEAEVENLRAEMEGMREDVKTLLALANKSKGGLWVGMSIAASVGGFVSWFIGQLRG